MESEYYYSQAGQRFGPIPGEQLKQMAAAGQLQPSDLIWKQGIPDWIAAAKVKGLFPTPPPPEAARPAAPPVASGAASWQPEGPDSRHFDAGEAARIQARQAKDAAVAAGGHALKAFQVLIRNPVGGLRETFDVLGPTPALGVGIVFAVIFAMCYLIGNWIGAGGIPAISTLFRQMLFSLIPIAAAVGVFFAAQMIFRGHGGIQADVFLAGASLLPLGSAALLLGIIASKSIMFDVAVLIVAFTTTTLMTYSGCTTILRVPDVVATFVVPLIFIVDVVVYRLLLGSPLGPGFGI